MVMNSPCAMLMTPICPKMIARPSPMSSSTANRLKPAKPCIRPMFSSSEKLMGCSASEGPRRRSLVALGERIGFDQRRRFRDHLERAVGLAHRDARFAPQVVVGVELHVAFGRLLQLDAGRSSDDL